MDSSRKSEVQRGPGWLTLGRNTQAAYPIVSIAVTVGVLFLLLPMFTRNTCSDESLYLIQGADRWLKEEDFNLYCQKKSR
jgi:hypothetical protein